MTSVADIRPTITPVSLRATLAGLDTQGFYVTNGQLVQIIESPLSLCGIAVPSGDCESGWLLVVTPGLKQYGVRFTHTVAGAGVSAVFTGEDGRAQAFERGLGVSIIQMVDLCTIVSQPRANIYTSPATRLTTMAVVDMNGKTTTSYLICATIALRFPNVSLCGTVETHVGPIPFEAMRTTAEAPVIAYFLAITEQHGCGVGVIELSTHALSPHRVDGVAFDVAAFTNLQYDHLNYYGDMENYSQAKAFPFTPEHSRHDVVCVDDEQGRRLMQQAIIPVTMVSALTEETIDWQVRDVTPGQMIGYAMFTLVDSSGTGHRVTMSIFGEVNTQNTAVAIVSAVNLGTDLVGVISAIEDAPQIPGRIEKVSPTPGDQPLVTIDYAHTPEALEWTLRSTHELTFGRVIVVFGTDGDRDATKREHLAQIVAREADVLWVTDKNPRTEILQEIHDYLLRNIASVRPGMEDATGVITCCRGAVRRAILAAKSGGTVIITGKGTE